MMKRNIAKRILRRGESGIALISVLLLIATGSLLALLDTGFDRILVERFREID